MFVVRGMVSNSQLPKFDSYRPRREVQPPLPTAPQLGNDVPWHAASCPAVLKRHTPACPRPLRPRGWAPGIFYAAR